MRRTIIEFIITCTLGCLCAVQPAPEAQQPTHGHRIGWLGSTPQGSAPFVEAFLEGMRALGYVEGQNLVMEYRWAEGQFERFPDLAAELVRLKVDVLMVNNTAGTLAAKHATTTIPIVMATVHDPVGSGLVASLARPGGNVTRLSNLSPERVGKQLEFLKEVLPTVSRVDVLWNPANLGHTLILREADVAAQALGVQLHLLEARGPDAFDSAFAAMTSAPAGALLVLGDGMFLQHCRRLAELAATSRLPTMYDSRAYVEIGGLISYGSSYPAQFRRAATYVAKILKGATPADLPVEQPMKFELVINLKTAKELGLTIPPTVLFQAYEVVK